MMRQHGVGPGLADHQRLGIPVIAEQHHTAMLIRIEPAQGALIDITAHQPPEFAGAEPGLGFEPEGMERAVVAGEEGGIVEVSHGWPPILRGLISRLVADCESL